MNAYAFHGFTFFSDNRPFLSNLINICEQKSKIVKSMDDEHVMTILYSQLCFQTIIQNFQEFLVEKDFHFI